MGGERGLEGGGGERRVVTLGSRVRRGMLRIGVAGTWAE
jgi:hypothetical protein